MDISILREKAALLQRKNDIRILKKLIAIANSTSENPDMIFLLVCLLKQIVQQDNEYIQQTASYWLWQNVSKMTEISHLRCEVSDILQLALPQHGFTFCNIIQHGKLGEQLIDTCVPYLLETINKDINTQSELENEEDPNNISKIELVKSRIAECFLLIGTFFKANITIYSELLLTSFCVKPTIETYAAIKEVAPVLYKDRVSNNEDTIEINHSLDTNSNCCSSKIPEESSSQRVNLQDINLEIYGLNDEHLDAILILNGSCRWQLLNWDLNLQDLQNLCEKYLQDPLNTRIKVRELKHLHIDYSSFIYKPKAVKKTDKKRNKRTSKKINFKPKKRNMTINNNMMLKILKDEDLVLKDDVQKVKRCEMCDKGFISMKALQLHRRKYHNIKFCQSVKTEKTSPPGTSKPVLNKSKETPESVLNNIKKTPESVLNYSKKTPESVLNNTKKTPESVLNNSKKTLESVLNNSKKTPESVLNNSKKTPKLLLNNSKKTPESVLNNSKKTTKLLLNNSKKTPKSVLNNSKKTSKLLLNKSKKTPESVLNNSKETPKLLLYKSKKIPESVLNKSKKTPESVLNKSKKTTRSNMKCDICNKMFCGSRKTLETHMTKYHISQIQLSARITAQQAAIQHAAVFTCKFCEKKFNCKNQLYNHVIITHTSLTQCKYCFKMFKNIKYHMDYYHWQVEECEKISCELCSLKFKRYCALNIHYQECHYKL